MIGVSESSTARLLQLLALLQARRDWAGPDLSQRLGGQRAHYPQGHQPVA